MFIIEYSFVKQVRPYKLLVIVKLAVYACFPLDKYNNEFHKWQYFNDVCKVNTIIKIILMTSTVKYYCVSVYKYILDPNRRNNPTTNSPTAASRS